MRLTDGYTLMHEHVTIDLSGVKGDEDCRLDCLDETIEEFRRLYAFGVRNILDVTNLGMGRNVELCVYEVGAGTGADYGNGTERGIKRGHRLRYPCSCNRRIWNRQKSHDTHGKKGI